MDTSTNAQQNQGQQVITHPSVPQQANPAADTVVSQNAHSVADQTQSNNQVPPMDPMIHPPSQLSNEQVVEPVPAQSVSAPEPMDEPDEPVGGSHKEFAPPITAPAESMPAQPAEYVTPSEPEPMLSPEVQEAGVETVTTQQHPTISHDMKAFDIAPAKESVPVQTAPSGAVQLPLSQDDAMQMKKTHPVNDSVRWLAELVIEQLKRAHQQVTGGS